MSTSQPAPARKHLESARAALRVAVPADSASYEQDEEWILVKQGGGWREVRIHDYDQLFAVPGLYERVVYDIMGCQSPQTLRKVLADQLRRLDLTPEEMRVLDLGAGNGYVAEELGGLGIDSFVGLDIEPMAKEAAERDRPGLYDDYIAADITDLPPAEEAKLERRTFNCLTCVAALGFGDIPPAAFVEAFNRVDDAGLIAITIKKDFYENDRDPSGFAALLRGLVDSGAVEKLEERAFKHRVNIAGEPITYVALVYRKRRDAEVPIA